MARKKKKVQRFNKRMKRRLSEVFIIVFLIFVFLGAQVVSITKYIMLFWMYASFCHLRVLIKRIQMK